MVPEVDTGPGEVLSIRVDGLGRQLHGSVALDWDGSGRLRWDSVVVHPAAWAAARIRSVTASGCETSEAWDELISTVWEPARAAMNSWVAGGDRFVLSTDQIPRRDRFPCRGAGRLGERGVGHWPLSGRRQRGLARWHVGGKGGPEVGWVDVDVESGCGSIGVGDGRDRCR